MGRPQCHDTNLRPGHQSSARAPIRPNAGGPIHKDGHVPVLAVMAEAAFPPVTALAPGSPLPDSPRAPLHDGTPPASSNPPHVTAHGPAGTQAFPAPCDSPGSPWCVPSLGLRQLEGLAATPSSSGQGGPGGVPCVSAWAVTGLWGNPPRSSAPARGETRPPWLWQGVGGSGRTPDSITHRNIP